MITGHHKSNNNNNNINSLQPSTLKITTLRVAIYVLGSVIIKFDRFQDEESTCTIYS